MGEDVDVLSSGYWACWDCSPQTRYRPAREERCYLCIARVSQQLNPLWFLSITLGFSAGTLTYYKGVLPQLGPCAPDFIRIFGYLVIFRITINYLQQSWRPFPWYFTFLVDI